MPSNPAAVVLDVAIPCPITRILRQFKNYITDEVVSCRNFAGVRQAFMHFKQRRMTSLALQFDFAS
jgi:hypothetical protein